MILIHDIYMHAWTTSSMPLSLAFFLFFSSWIMSHDLPLSVFRDSGIIFFHYLYLLYIIIDSFIFPFPFSFLHCHSSSLFTCNAYSTCFSLTCLIACYLFMIIAAIIYLTLSNHIHIIHIHILIHIQDPLMLLHSRSKSSFAWNKDRNQRIRYIKLALYYLENLWAIATDGGSRM